MQLPASSVVRLDRAPARCGDCPIRHRAVCAYCEPRELHMLDAIKSYKTYQPGEEIVAAGEETAHVGSVVTGVVNLTKTMIDGRRQMVGLLFPSDFIGRPMRPVAPYDATAVTEVTLCRFQRPRFETLIRSTPAIETRLLEMTLDELDAAREWMLLLGRKSAREKVASFLVIIARRAANLAESSLDDGIQVEVPLTRESMADYLGLTIETVSRQFSSLKKAGVIELKDSRHVAIPDFARLLDTAGDDSDGGALY